MNGSVASNALVLFELALCIAGLGLILFRKQGAQYKFLCMFLAFRVGFSALFIPLMMLSGHGIERHVAYRLYFYFYWASFAAESIVGLLLIYGIFNLAMAPLGGLKKLGTLVFRWAASISLAIALGSAMIPHVDTKAFIVLFVTQLQRTQSILTLSLLLFVCFAIRPLGLTYSSRIFGVSLGLGILATCNLVASAWMAHFKNIYSDINTIQGVVTCGVLLLWTSYFALPEPKRRIIVLPTTSPFLRWNQISEILGDAPGFVAIAGIPPELFAPAELEIMRRASIKMSDQPTTLIQHSQTA
jgi:hypothetical protein